MIRDNCPIIIGKATKLSTVCMISFNCDNKDACNKRVQITLDSLFAPHDG